MWSGTVCRRIRADERTVNEPRPQNISENISPHRSIKGLTLLAMKNPLQGCQISLNGKTYVVEESCIKSPPHWPSYKETNNGHMPFIRIPYRFISNVNCIKKFQEFRYYVPSLILPHCGVDIIPVFPITQPNHQGCHNDDNRAQCITGHVKKHASHVEGLGWFFED